MKIHKDPQMPGITALIAGAGSGTRLGAELPKALVNLAGEALIVHAVRAMNAADINKIVITIPSGFEQEFHNVLAQANLEARLITGGATRQESIAKGMSLADTEYVLVHDAARALTPPSVIRAVVNTLLNGAKAVIPALPAVDTIKSAIPVNNDGNTKILVTETLDRAQLYCVQTPQGFSRKLLAHAHKAGAALSADERKAAPDDAALVERLGEKVQIIPGHAHCLKITTPFDLQVAQLLLATRNPDE